MVLRRLNTKTGRTVKLLFVISVIAACGLVALTTLKPKSEAPIAEVTPITIASLGYAKANAQAMVSLSLPDTIKAYPELHRKLYTEGEADLKLFVDQATKDHAEAATQGTTPPPYSRTITWKMTGESVNLVSLLAEISEFTGGAHPANSFQTVIWDNKKKAIIDPKALFLSGVNMQSVDTFLCRQIEAERSKRLETPTTQASSGFTCPRLLDSHLTLVPSTIAGKIGGLTVSFAPYEVGAYAEGPYRILIAQNVFERYLDVTHTTEFGGDPLPEGAIVSTENKPSDTEVTLSRASQL
jgi:hypothetical protein